MSCNTKENAVLIIWYIEIDHLQMPLFIHLALAYCKVMAHTPVMAEICTMPLNFVPLSTGQATEPVLKFKCYTSIYTD